MMKVNDNSHWYDTLTHPKKDFARSKKDSDKMKVGILPSKSNGKRKISKILFMCLHNTSFLKKYIHIKMFYWFVVDKAWNGTPEIIRATSVSSIFKKKF